MTRLYQGNSVSYQSCVYASSLYTQYVGGGVPLSEITAEACLATIEGKAKDFSESLSTRVYKAAKKMRKGIPPEITVA